MKTGINRPTNNEIEEDHNIRLRKEIHQQYFKILKLKRRIKELEEENKRLKKRV